MKLQNVLQILPQVKLVGNDSIEFLGITDDSRKVNPGDLFIAVRGTVHDGHEHVQKAVEAGAAAVLVERQFDDVVCTQIIVPSTQAVLSKVALAFYGNPQDELVMIGVTGTNGKTTISTLIYQVLDQLGYTAGLIGTVAKRIGKEVISSNLTTPGAIELAKDLAAMRDAGCSHVAMEVSSHALKQHRVSGIHFSVALFTNLTHDHLDYHQTFEDYAASKQILFNELSADATAIINMDDAYGSFMAQQTKASVWDVSFKAESQNQILKNDSSGLSIYFDGSLLASPLVGNFNAYNVSQAYLACIAVGANANGVIEALAQQSGANGRLDKIQLETSVQLPFVFVDYAHTPDALENVASTLDAIKKEGEELIIVFGCGGNRDAKKRPVMAAIAEKYADKIVITSDNPRFEHPEAILDDIEKGFSTEATFERITDRPKAIADSIKKAPENSMILIAGKGHETYQEVEGVRYPMDDRVIAHDALKHRLKRIELEKEAS
ncbi:UDP-N-acetylmuramoyl-L-alanyl-D-glutamate--2,6-diaminopimelate ligase [bacterium]|nr:MAG: UDP-N-acetylmuramoyl-L-alanyl-D-glutamate--2,6-diaminopimelate ligase [bacterium]